MGVYYFYVNDTKQCYFCIDPSYSDIKQYALGRNIGSRALSYLLLDNDPDFTCVDAHPLVGTWIGDRFFVTGDDYCPRFDAIESGYSDIGQTIIEMMVAIRPYDLVEYGGLDWLLDLIERDGDPILITNEMRKRLSHHLRHEQHLHPNEKIKKVVDALRR